MLRHNLMMSVPNICFAYDATDAADRKILKDAVDAAIRELNTEHEQDIQGLKAKNTELIDKLKKAQDGKIDAQAVERLETQLEEAQNQLKQVTKDHKKAVKDLEESRTTLEQVQTRGRETAIDAALTEQLTGAKVPTALLGGAKALLKAKVQAVDENGTLVIKAGDKALGDFIKEWSLGDEGKHYVSAGGNTGGGAGGARPGQNNPNQTTVKRSEYEANPNTYAAGLASRTVVLADD